MFFKKEKKHHVTPELLDGLIRGLNYVANCASDMALSHYQNLISQYFTEQDDGSFKPNTAIIQLDEEHVITMPWIAVSDGKGLFLDEMEVDFSVQVTGIDNGRNNNDSTADNIAAKLNSRPDLPHFIVTVANNSSDSTQRAKDIIDFKIKFKSHDAPEAVMRVIDKFNASIHPVRLKNDDNNIENSAEPPA